MVHTFKNNLLCLSSLWLQINENCEFLTFALFWLCFFAISVEKKVADSTTDMDSDAMISYSDTDSEPHFYMEENSEPDCNGAEMQAKLQFSLAYCF